MGNPAGVRKKKREKRRKRHETRLFAKIMAEHDAVAAASGGKAVGVSTPDHARSPNATQP